MLAQIAYNRLAVDDTKVFDVDQQVILNGALRVHVWVTQCYFHLLIMQLLLTA